MVVDVVIPTERSASALSVLAVLLPSDEFSVAGVLEAEVTLCPLVAPVSGSLVVPIEESEVATGEVAVDTVDASETAFVGVVAETVSLVTRGFVAPVVANVIGFVGVVDETIVVVTVTVDVPAVPADVVVAAVVIWRPGFDLSGAVSISFDV